MPAGVERSEISPWESILFGMNSENIDYHSLTALVSFCRLVQELERYVDG